MKEIVLKIIMLTVLLALSACVSIPEDSSWPSPETGAIKENKSSNNYYSPDKGLKTPPRPKYGDKPNSAVISLVSAARELKNHGEYSASAAKTERALRIDPMSVSAYGLLAEVRLLQGQNIEAEQLAKKGLSILASRKNSRSKDQKMEQLRFIVAEAQSKNNY